MFVCMDVDVYVYRYIVLTASLEAKVIPLQLPPQRLQV